MSARHIPELDGIRGLAILLVVGFHVFWFPFSLGVFKPIADGSGFWLQKLLLSAWIGVDLFFVLSGFLITRLLLQAKGESKAYRRFYGRRALRIFPPYFLLLALWPLLASLYPESLRHGDDFGARMGLWSYTSNWMIGFWGWDRLPMPLTHSWTLSIEEQFYLIWPLLILTLDRRWSLRLCLGLLVLCPVARMLLDPLLAYMATPARLDALAAGAALALWDRPLPRWTVPGFAALIAVIFIWREGLAGEDRVMLILGLSALLGLFVSILAQTVYRAPRWSTVFAMRPLRWLGKYSYGIYLYHQPVIILILLRLYRTPEFYIPAAVFVPLLVAVLSYHLWEMRFLRLKSELKYS